MSGKWQVAIAVAALLTALNACTAQDPPISITTPSPGSPSPQAASPAGSPAPSQTGSKPSAGSESGFAWTKSCVTSLPSQWKAELKKNRFAGPLGLPGQALYLRSDGSRAVQYVKSTLAGPGNFFRWEAPGGKTWTIDRFEGKRSQYQVLGADAADGFLTYSVWPSPSDTNWWKLFVWKIGSSDPPFEIAESSHGKDGYVAGPLNYPVAASGRVFWVQVKGDEGITSHIYSYSFESKEQQTVTTSLIPTGIWRTRDSIYWSGAAAEGELATFRSLDPGTLTESAAPPALDLAQGPLSLAIADDTYAWSQSDGRTLFLARAGHSQPLKAVSLREGNGIWEIHMAGHFLTWAQVGSQWVLDLRTGGYARLTTDGSTMANGGPWLSVGLKADGPKGVGESEAATFDTTELPGLPGC